MWTHLGRLIRAGALLALPACGAPKRQGVAELPAGAVALPPDQVARIVSRPYSGIGEPRRAVIRDSSEWARFWGEVTRGLSPSPAPPPVDFERDMVVVVALGPRRTGGYAVTVENVYRHDGRLYVVVRETAPGPTCLLTQALTSPLEVVRLPQTDEPVSFIEKREVRTC